jgi:hypothetical protein
VLINILAFYIRKLYARFAKKLPNENRKRKMNNVDEQGIFLYSVA